MRTIKCFVCAAFFLVSTAIVIVSADAGTAKRPAAPVIKEVQGEVSVRSGAAGAWQPVKNADHQLKNGSTIRTGAGTVSVACPDGSRLTLDKNTTATLSIARDGRVQIDTAQGNVKAVLGKSAATVDLGPDQAIQSKYNKGSGDVDVSCVKGNATVGMPDGAKIGLRKGDVITATPKKNLVKSQAGTVQVTKGTETRPLNVGFEIVLDDPTPFYYRRFPYVAGRYGYMTDYVTTTEEYTVTEETTTTVEDKGIEQPDTAAEEQETAVEEQETPGTDAGEIADEPADSADTGADIGGADDGGDSGADGGVDAGGDSGDSGGGDGGGGDGGGGGE
ncbi:MAG TPA: hypothetical protein P5287_00465 [bacterium]|nr:hypothetical protein [bacterium]